MTVQAAATPRRSAGRTAWAGRHLDATARLARLVDLPASPQTCPILLAAVGDPSLEVARRALGRLVVLGGADEGEALADRLLELDPGIVRDAATCLRMLNPEAGAAAAIDGLLAGDHHRRQAAAIVLEQLQWEPARDRLEAALGDPSAAVRRAAVDALAALPAAPVTVGRVAARLRDRDIAVRIAAVDALVRLAPNAPSKLAIAARDRSARVRAALAARTSQLPTDLVEALLDDRDADVVADVLWQLVAMPRLGLVPVVQRRLSHRDWHVRRAACRALGSARSSPSIAHLVDRLEDPHATVRQAALRALREVDGRHAATVIGNRLAHVDGDRRAVLLYALAQIDPAAALDAVRSHDLSSDGAAVVRIAVCRVVEPAELERSFAKLAEDSDPAVRNAAAAVLANASGPAGSGRRSDD